MNKIILAVCIFLLFAVALNTQAFSINSFNGPFSVAGNSCAQSPVLIASGLTSGDTLRIENVSGSLCYRVFPRTGTCVSDVRQGCALPEDCGNYGVVGFYGISNNLIAEYSFNNLSSGIQVPSGAVSAYAYINDGVNYFDNNGAYSCSFNAKVIPPTCSTNSQCGDSGFLSGTENCVGNNVYKNYKTFTCNLAGSAGAYCSDTTDNRIFQPCTDGKICSGGQCIYTVCGNLANSITNFINTYGYYVGCGDTRYVSNFDVNDDKVINASDVFKAQYLMSEVECSGNRANVCCTANAKQQCANDGTIHSYNSCGSDEGQVQACSGTTYNGAFCRTGFDDVYQNKTTSTCQNDSTTTASCHTNTTPEIKLPYCIGGQTCVAGICQCINNASQKCGTDNKIYNYNSCNQPQMPAVRDCSAESGYTNTAVCNATTGNIERTYRTYGCTENSTTCSFIDRVDSTSCDFGCQAGHTECNSELIATLNSDKPEAKVNETITFTATAVGGTGSYIYAWSGANCELGTEKNICKTSFSNIGNKEVMVNVYSGSQIKPASKIVEIKTNCTDNAKQQCASDGTIHTYDSCGNDKGQVQACSSPTYEGAFCQAGQTNVFQNKTTYTCQNDSLTTASCHESTTVEVKLPYCREGQTCKDGSCQCTQDVSQKCSDDNKIYNYNSCDQKGSFVKDCSAESGYIGSPTCGTDGKIHQNYRIASCSLGQTVCSYVLEDRATTCDLGYACDTDTKTCQKITCSSDSDCSGGDIWTGDAVCQSGNVWKNYLTKVCQDKGTTKSKCVDVNTLTEKQNCKNDNKLCSDTTKNCECTKNASQKCGNDGKIHQFDSCGAMQPEVVLDCSTRNTTGEKYCDTDGHVHQITQTYSCNYGDTTCKADAPNNTVVNSCNSATQYCKDATCRKKLSALLIAVPSEINSGDEVVFNAFASGGDETFKYVWDTGVCVQYGNATSSCSVRLNNDTYNTETQIAVVTVQSDGKSIVAFGQVKVRPRCTFNDSRRCVTNNDGSTSVYYYNSCGERGDLITDCTRKTLCQESGKTASCQPIDCVDNTDCSLPTFGNLYCGSGFDINKVFQNKTIYECQNANSFASRCVAKTPIAEPKKDCSETNQACVNGACVCTKDAGQKCGSDGRIYKANSCGDIQLDSLVKTCSDSNGLLNDKRCGTDNNVHQTLRTFSCSAGQADCVSADHDQVTDCVGQGQVCDPASKTCQTVACSATKPCKSEELSGTQYCKNGTENATKIFQNYITYSCENSGRVDSVCRPSTITRSQDCSADSICDLTENRCKPVECTSLNALAKCGSEIATGQLFCGVESDGQNPNAVFQKFDVPYCDLAGTTDSDCKVRQESRLQTTCSGFCQSGQCYDNLSASLFAEPPSAKVGEQITFTALPVGGIGGYTYTWLQAACKADTAPNICKANFSETGEKEVLVYVHSGNKNFLATVKVNILPNCTLNAKQQCADDGTIHTYDSCGNDKGQVQACLAPTYEGSFCRTGFNNVFQNKITYTCQNDSLTTASCHSNTTVVVKEPFCNSTQTCVSGSCQNIACTADNVATACGKTGYVENSKVCSTDHKQVIQDYITWSCDNAGQANAQCNSITTHPATNCALDQLCSDVTKNCETVTCSDTKLCPGTKTSQGMTCYNGDVYEEFLTPTCINSGALNSKCENQITREWRVDCTSNQTCSNGACVNAVPDVTVSLVANPNPAKTNQAVLFSATNVSGGNGVYAYSWSGICDDVGNNSICAKNNLAVGNYPVTVTVNSGGKSNSASTTLIVEQACGGASPRCGTDSKIHNYDTCGNDLGIVDDCSTRNSTGNRTCGADGNVHQTNLVGSCSANQTTCTTTSSNPIVETCNAETQTCINGACVNKQINCSTDSQCGANVDVGDPFCQSGDVYINHKTWDCVLQGTPASRCEYSVTPRLVTDCTSEQTCSNGSCQNVYINCSSKTDCGNDGYIGDPFCQSGNIWQNFRTYTCNDAGNPGSYCSDSSAPQQKITCGSNQTCTNGACVNNPTDFTVSASASPNPATTTQQVTFTPTVSDTTRTYSYIWTGDCVGINQTCHKTFSQPGSYTAILTVTSGSQTKIASASVNVSAVVTTPSVQTNSATNIQLNSATLNGNITSLGGDSSASVWFEWGTTSGYGYQTSHQTLSSLTSFSQTASGLANNTTYHYRAVIQNSNSTNYGQDITFTTTTQTPSVSVPTANAGPDQYVNPGQNVALYGSGSDPNGQTITYSWSCSGGYVTNPNIAQTIFVAPNYNNYGGNYYCTLTVRNASGLSASDDMIVRTNYINNNIISNSNVQTNSATNISINSASLNGSVYNYNNYSYNNYNYNNYGNSTVWFQYGLYTSYGYETIHQQNNYAGQFSQYVSNLQPNTLYHFRAVMQDNYGQTYYGQDMTFQTLGGQGVITAIKSVRNLTSGTNWASSVTAKPGDLLSFMIVTSVTNTSQQASNVTVRDILPSTLINRTNVLVDNSTAYGDLNSGVNIGYVSPSQMRTITYQVQVAPASNFVYGSTTVTNNAYITSTDSSGSATASASVIVTRAGVLGATSVSTGLTNNIWLDSFFLPLLVALLGLWGYKSGILGIDEWVARRKTKTKDFRASKKLEEKISQIKTQEKSSWPTL